MPPDDSQQTYQMQAPDGNTYRIQGPRGASDDQVRSEILKQHPNAGTAPQPMTAGRAALGVGEIVGAGIVNTPINMVNAAAAEITGRDKPFINPVQPGAAARDLQSTVKKGVLAAGASVVPESMLKDPALMAKARETQDWYSKPAAQRFEESGHPGLAKLETHLEHAATLAPLAAGVAGGVARAIGAEEFGTFKVLDEIGRTYKQRGYQTAEDAQSAAVGFRNARTTGNLAWQAAGHEGKRTLTNNNADVGRVLAKHDAGVPMNVELTEPALEKAERLPNRVYDRVFNRLPPSTLSGDSIKAINKVIAETEDASVAQKLKMTLDNLAGPQTGKQLQDRISKLRKDGFRSIDSDDSSERNLGKARLGIADVLENHVEETLNKVPNSGTSIQQFRDARQARARIETVRYIRQGKDINFARLVKLHENNPGMISGALKYAAQFAEQPENQSFTGKRMSELTGAAMREFAEGKTGVVARGLTALPRWSGIPQRALRKGARKSKVPRMEGARAAQRYFGGRDNSVFAPIAGKGVSTGEDLAGRFSEGTGGAFSDMDSDLR